MLNRRNLMIMVLQGMFEYLLLFPLFLIIGIYVVDPLQLWIWLVSIFIMFVIGLVFKTLLHNQRWWIYAFFSIVIGVVPSVIFGGHILFLILLAIIHTIIIYRGIMYGSRSWDNLISVSFLWFGGFSIYFIGYFFFRYVEVLNPHLTLITMCGAILVVAILFISNRDHLKASTLSKEKKPFVSSVIKNQNRVFLIITVVVIALLTNGKAIQEGLWNGFKALIKFLIGLVSGSENQTTIDTPPPDSMDPVLPFEEAKEPSAIWKLLEEVMMYVMYVFLFLVAIVLLLLLIKKTRVWMKQIISKLILFLKQIVNRSVDSQETGKYIDEKESVFNWEEWKKEQQEKAKGFVQNIFKREPNWKSLSNKQKVRLIYRRFLLQEVGNINYKTTDTPRETLEELMASETVDEAQVRKLRDAYEQIRYGEKDIAENKIEEIYPLIKKK